MKKILIINGHPDKESLCFALAESYKKGAELSGADCKLINLVDLDFNPILTFGYRKVSEYLQLGEEKLKQKKDYSSVVEYSNNILRIEPKNADAFLMRAKAFLLMDKKLDSSIAWRDANSAIFYKPEPYFIV